MHRGHMGKGQEYTPSCPTDDDLKMTLNINRTDGRRICFYESTKDLWTPICHSNDCR